MRYHPHWKIMAITTFPLLIFNAYQTYWPTLYFASSHSFSCKILFNQSAPECSLCLLFQTALSVGDAVFLSTSEDKSLFHRFFCCLYVSIVLVILQVFFWKLSKTGVFIRHSFFFFFTINRSLTFRLCMMFPAFVTFPMTFTLFSFAWAILIYYHFSSINLQF